MPWRRRDRRPAEPAQPSSVNISGITNSAVATGSHNQMHVSSPVTTHTTAPPPDPALEAAIAALRAVVEAQAGPRKNEALTHVTAIESAAHATPPDGTKLAAAADWIKAALPAAAPAIASVIEHPTLDTAVAAAAQVLHDTAHGHAPAVPSQRHEAGEA